MHGLELCPYHTVPRVEWGRCQQGIEDTRPSELAHVAQACVDAIEHFVEHDGCEELFVRSPVFSCTCSVCSER